MKSYSDRKREKSIKEFFAEKLHRFALHLQVPTLPDSFFKSLYANPPETGSDQPRALLAYYYAFAHTVREFSSALTAPWLSTVQSSRIRIRPMPSASCSSRSLTYRTGCSSSWARSGCTMPAMSASR